MNGSIDTGNAVRHLEPVREARLPAIQGAAARSADRPAQPETEKRPAETRDLSGAVSQIRDFVHMVRRELQFSVDENTGRTVVTVRDAQTEEVIRQIPAEEVLNIAARLEEVNGVLFRGRA